MDVAPDHVVVHQPINDVGGLFFRGADHRGMPHEIAHIDKCHHADALVLAQVLERIIGIEGIHSHFEFLSVTGCVEHIRVLPVDVRQVHPVHQPQDAIVGILYVLK